MKKGRLLQTGEPLLDVDYRRHPFILRVEQKVNLSGARPGRAVQHILKKGTIADACPERTGRGNPNIMTQNLTYRGPEPSRATRSIARRSKASLRGSMVVKLPGFDRPRIIQFESVLEYTFLCLILMRSDIHHIWEQPPAVAYAGAGGRSAKHIFDFLVTTTIGERIAVAIKPMQRVIQQNFVAELERVAAATPKQFADRIVLITERHLDRVAAAEAARKLAWSRAPLTEVAA